MDSYLSYTVDKDFYSEQYGQEGDILFPNASLNTYISGNSRLSKLNLWSGYNNKEKQIKDEMEEFAKIITDLPFDIKNFSLNLYKKLSELYKENKKKKTKIKLYSYILFLAYKNNGELISHQYIAQLLNISTKTVCKSIKEVDVFLHQKSFKIDFNEDISIKIYFQKLNLNLEKIQDIENIYLVIKNHSDFIQHKPNSVLAGIICFCFPELDKYHISQIMSISETTTYQIYKKLVCYMNIL